MINKILLSALLSSLLFFCSVTELQAIPVFARKYDQSCSLCHVSTPKLNAYGEAFRLNGYRLPKETIEQVKQDQIKLGGKVQQKLWPLESIWPGEIPGTTPIAIRMKLDFNLNPDDSIKYDFQFPHEIEIIAGGSLGKSVSALLELAIYEDGGFGGLERAFLQFHRLISNSKLINLKIGQFEPNFVPFSRMRRITMAHYLLSAFKNGANSFRMKDWQQGIEMWGIRDATGGGGGLLYSIGIVNGSSAGHDHSTGAIDNNTAKDVYGRLSYKFGGLALSGESGVTPQGGNWRDNSFRLGTFWYLGTGLKSDFYRTGFDMRWQYNDVDLFGAAMYGMDRFATGDMAFSAYFIEGNYVFLPWIVLALRYELAITPDDNSVSDLQNLLANISFSIRPNIVVRIELLKELSDRGSIAGKIRFDFAF